MFLVNIRYYMAGCFTVLPQYRRIGYGKKVLLDTIEYCKILKNEVFRVETTYYENKPALFLHDKVMEMKEEYTIEDIDTRKNNTLIYSYSLNGKLEL